MRKIFSMLLILVGALACLTACNDYETYGDKKEKERAAIKNFIEGAEINVITEAEFHANGDVTDTAKNEFVYLNNNGVYMQIVRKGCGTPIRDGENTTLLVRFVELCLMDSMSLFNDDQPYDPDYMNVSRNGNTYTASFTKGQWCATYGTGTYATTSVPAGLLAVFPYINVGRPRTEDDQIAKVLLIVPHTQGHTVATSYVYPYYYELTFQRQIDL